MKNKDARRLQALFEEAANPGKPDVRFDLQGDGSLRVHVGVGMGMAIELPPKSIEGGLDEEKARGLVLSLTHRLMMTIRIWISDAYTKCPLCWGEIEEQTTLTIDGAPRYVCGACGWKPPPPVERVNGADVELGS